MTQGESNAPAAPRNFIQYLIYLGVIVVVGGLLLCACVGPLHNLIVGTMPTQTQPAEVQQQTQPPTEPPTQAVTQTEVVTTEAPTETVTQTTEATTQAPTEATTEAPTQKVTFVVTLPPTQPACQVIVGDGICDTRCENTDLDKVDCTCHDNGICEPGEGFNCKDCTWGQCGKTCSSDADCGGAPGEVCIGGKCGGPACPAPKVTCVCAYGPYGPYLQCSDGTTRPASFYTCPGS